MPGRRVRAACPSRGGSSTDGFGLGRGWDGHFVGTGIGPKCETSWRGASIPPAGTTSSASGSCMATREHIAVAERMSRRGSPSPQSAASADASLSPVTRRRVDSFVYPRSATLYRQSASIQARATGPPSPRGAAAPRYLIRTSPRRPHPHCCLEQARACTTSGRIPDRLGT